MGKICRRCGQEKPIEDFYAHKQMLDGHLNICKECVKARVKKHRENNAERIRKYDRNRPNAKERMKQEYNAIRNDKNRLERRLELQRIWGKENRTKRNAHCKVQRAVKKGLLIKPNACQICGKTNCVIQGHHYDYSKPLDVIWVCSECHGKIHKKYKD